jgi:hypothetical protein
MTTQQKRDLKSQNINRRGYGGMNSKLQSALDFIQDERQDENATLA